MNYRILVSSLFFATEPILLEHYHFYSPQYPLLVDGLSYRWISRHIELPGFDCSYMRFGHEELVFSQIKVTHQMRGKGFFSAIVKALRAANVNVMVELPQSRLKGWCQRNGVLEPPDYPYCRVQA